MFVCLFPFSLFDCLFVSLNTLRLFFMKAKHFLVIRYLSEISREGGGGGGGDFKFGFGNEVTYPCNGSEIC